MAGVQAEAYRDFGEALEIGELKLTIRESAFSGKLGKDYRLFKKVRPHYDKFQETVGKAIRKAYRDSKQDEIKVFEFGCGTGDTTEKIVSADTRLKITAVDTEKVMLNQAMERLSKYVEEGKLKFVLSDGLAVLRKTPDKSFDVFASAFAINILKRKERSRLLKEAYRVLKGGGLFVNADKYAQDNPKEYQKHLRWQIKRFDIFEKMGRPDLKKQWTRHYLQDASPEAVMKEGEAIEEMRKIGFRGTREIFRWHIDATIIARK